MAGNGTPIDITSNRLKAAVGVTVFGFIGVAVVVESIPHGGVGGIAIGVIILAGAFAFALRVLTGSRGLVIDDDGLTLGRSGRRVSWDEISVARIRVHQGPFGESHELVVTLENGDKAAPRKLITTNATATDELTVALDGMSLSWSQIVEIIEARSGRRVVTARAHAFGS